MKMTVDARPAHPGIASMTGMSMIEQPTAINVNPLSIFP